MFKKCYLSPQSHIYFNPFTWNLKILKLTDGWHTCYSNLTFIFTWLHCLINGCLHFMTFTKVALFTFSQFSKVPCHLDIFYETNRLCDAKWRNAPNTFFFRVWSARLISFLRDWKHFFRTHFDVSRIAKLELCNKKPIPRTSVFYTHVLRMINILNNYH